MGFWNALASAYGTHQQNKNIDKQLAAQKQEQQQNRLYNLELAKQQNSWNIQQWNRENAYNSPSAQMERMKQAGLNPDMMYGGGVSGNLAASSPQMTSGAPSSPMDWSALGSKKTVGDFMMQKAQMENIEAQTEKIKSDTKGQDISNAFAPAEKMLGLQLTQSQIDLNRKGLEELSKKIEKIDSEIQNLDVDSASKVQQILFKSKLFEHEIRKLAAEADVADAEAKVALETMFSRIGIVSQQHQEAISKADAAKAEADLKRFQHDKRIWDEFLRVVDRGVEIADVILGFKNFDALLRGTVTVTQGPKGVTITETTKNKN